jgi:hypothetical protein
MNKDVLIFSLKIFEEKDKPNTDLLNVFGWLKAVGYLDNGSFPTRSTAEIV